MPGYRLPEVSLDRSYPSDAKLEYMLKITVMMLGYYIEADAKKIASMLRTLQKSEIIKNNIAIGRQAGALLKLSMEALEINKKLTEIMSERSQLVLQQIESLSRPSQQMGFIERLESSQLDRISHLNDRLTKLTDNAAYDSIEAIDEFRNEFINFIYDCRGKIHEFRDLLDSKDFFEIDTDMREHCEKVYEVVSPIYVYQDSHIMVVDYMRKFD